MDNSSNPAPTTPHDFYAFTHLILFSDNFLMLDEVKMIFAKKNQDFCV
jgi:hypothetical protein